MPAELFAADHARRAAEDYARLVGIEAEYNTTIIVVAVLVERLQQLTGDLEVKVSDAEVREVADLKAWRNPTEHHICLKTSR